MFTQFDHCFQFFCLLLIILVAEVSAGAWAYTNSSQLKELVRESVKTTVQDEYGVVDSRTLTFDAIQQGVSSCIYIFHSPI